MSFEQIKLSYAFDAEGDSTRVNKIISSDDALTLDDALEVYEEFLRAAGYSFKGSLRFVEVEAKDKPIEVGCFVKSKGPEHSTALLDADTVYEVKNIIGSQVVLTVYAPYNQAYDLTYPMDWFNRVL